MKSPRSFDDLRDEYADFFGRASALYNINPLLGRLYGYLLLSPNPMTLDNLVQVAGAAKSTVSVAMKSLEHYRLVQRQWKKGDRRDYFVARTDAVNVLRELYQLFFSQELKYMRDANAKAKETLDSVENQEGWPNPDERRELLQRLSLLENVASVVTHLLEQMMGVTSTQSAKSVKSIAIEVEE